MEIELLDQLLTSDEPLSLAGRVFRVWDAPANFERARRAIAMQAKEGVLQVIWKGSSQERILEDWEIKQVLADEKNWLPSSAEATYFLRITEEGAKLV